MMQRMWFATVLMIPATALAAGVQEQLKIKEVEANIARALENHVNSDALTGGINAPICAPADSLQQNPCKALPKAEWASVSATVDWASFDGNLDESHGFDAVQGNCVDVLMGLNWLSNQGSRAEKNAYQKAARDRIKSVRCRFDARASKGPILELKGGVLKAGINWDTGAERSLNVLVGEWLLKKL